MNAAERLWSALAAQDWAVARSQFRAQAVVEWPHAGRRMTRDEYIAAQRAQLSSGRVEVHRTAGEGKIFAVEASIGTRRCAGFYDLHDGLIHAASEYWVGGAGPG
jgi:hypothetical protein